MLIVFYPVLNCFIWIGLRNPPCIISSSIHGMKNWGLERTSPPKVTQASQSSLPPHLYLSTIYWVPTMWSGGQECSREQDRSPLLYILHLCSLWKCKELGDKGLAGFWVGSAPPLAGGPQSELLGVSAFYMLYEIHSAASLNSLTDAKIKRKIAISVWWLWA